MPSRAVLQSSGTPEPWGALAAGDFRPALAPEGRSEVERERDFGSESVSSELWKSVLQPWDASLKCAKFCIRITDYCRFLFGLLATCPSEAFCR